MEIDAAIDLRVRGKLERGSSARRRFVVGFATDRMVETRYSSLERAPYRRLLNLVKQNSRTEFGVLGTRHASDRDRNRALHRPTPPQAGRFVWVYSVTFFPLSFPPLFSSGSPLIPPLLMLCARPSLTRCWWRAFIPDTPSTAWKRTTC